MTHIKPTSWKKRLEKYVGDDAIHNDVFSEMIKAGRIEVANNKEEENRGDGFKYLLSQYLYCSKEIIDELKPLKQYKSYESKEHCQLDGQPASCIKIDHQTAAYTRFLENMLNRDDRIKTFRNKELKDTLLNENNIAHRLKKIALLERLDNEAGHSFKQALFIVDREGKRKSIEYRMHGTINRLLLLAERFAHYWPTQGTERAAWFILTGVMLPIAPASRYFETSPNKIIIEVSPHLPIEYIAELYKEARKEFHSLFQQDIKETFSRQLKDKHLKLALFCSETSGSWSERMELWNTQFPDWNYKNRPTFARDCRVALERVKYTFS